MNVWWVSFEMRIMLSETTCTIKKIRSETALFWSFLSHLIFKLNILFSNLKIDNILAKYFSIAIDFVHFAANVFGYCQCGIA
jgi:hypothetical protein